MHKKHSLSHLRLILSDVMINGYEALRSLHKDLDTIDMDTTDPLEIERGQRLGSTIVLVNHIIHPGHDVSLTMLPGAKYLIEAMQRNHETAIEKKLILRDECYSCTHKELK